MDYERYGEDDNTKAAFETLQRFERLQCRFGRWGLAWLESLLRCADVLASKGVKPTE
jgi:CRISPR-associated endonuclease/helicase Cas3